MFLLDTNVVSEARKVGDGRADPNVTAWCAAQDASLLFISALTLMEIEIGVLSVERRDLVQGRLLRAFMDDHIVPAFAG